MCRAYNNLQRTFAAAALYLFKSLDLCLQTAELFSSAFCKLRFVTDTGWRCMTDQRALFKGVWNASFKVCHEIFAAITANLFLQFHPLHERENYIEFIREDQMEIWWLWSQAGRNTDFSKAMQTCSSFELNCGLWSHEGYFAEEKGFTVLTNGILSQMLSSRSASLAVCGMSESIVWAISLGSALGRSSAVSRFDWAFSVGDCATNAAGLVDGTNLSASVTVFWTASLLSSIAFRCLLFCAVIGLLETAFLFRRNTSPSTSTTSYPVDAWNQRKRSCDTSTEVVTRAETGVDKVGFMTYLSLFFESLLDAPGSAASIISCFERNPLQIRESDTNRMYRVLGIGNVAWTIAHLFVLNAYLEPDTRRACKQILHHYFKASLDSLTCFKAPLLAEN